MFRRMMVLGCSLSCWGASAPGQSLYERPVAAPPVRTVTPSTATRPASETEGLSPAVAPHTAPAANSPASAPHGVGTPQQRYIGPAPAPSLAAICLYAVDAPKNRLFAENDLVTIIISERSKTERNQKLDAKKDYSIDAKVSAWIDLLQLLEARAKPDGNSIYPSVGLESKSDFKGDGKYNREDKLTDRIQARIVEVKPNGTLLLEARRSIRTDKEVQSVVLSGTCRTEDVTEANSIQSNQLFDLALDVQNSGEVKDVSKKGLIPRVLETLFNF